jgi:dienelactone hydrolase
MVDIVYGIDGTGPNNDSVYRYDFKDSFVRHLCTYWPTTEAEYVRGPTIEGLGTGPKAVAATRRIVDLVKKHRGLGHPVRVILTGYSRGGASVVRVARNLRGFSINVDALILFDAVDRSLVIGTDRIPGNVKVAIHARRDPLAMSRQSFSNTATTYELGVDYREKFFFGTHGAVGGARWKEAGKTGYVHEVDGNMGDAVQFAGKALGSLLGAAAFIGSQGRIDYNIAQTAGGALTSAGAFRIVATKSTLNDEIQCEADTLKWVREELMKAPLTVNLPPRPGG